LLAAGRGEIDSNQEFDSANDRKVMFRFQFKREELGEIFKLRSLSISKDNVHDHVFCWQNDCERLLRSKLIYPNANTIFFKVVEDKKGFPYSFETGMPPLNQKKITERNRKLSHWKQDIQDLEE